MSFQASFLDGDLPDSAKTEILLRSYTDEGVGVFELLACRDLASDFGLYQGNLLVDDFREDTPNGTDVIVEYLFVLSLIHI